MPYRIDFMKDGHKGNKTPHFMLYNITKGSYVNKHFKTKETAKNAGFNFMKYRKEVPILKGSKILNKNKY